MGVTVTYLFFHWALDYATVIQVATVTTTIPIFVGLANWAVNGVIPAPSRSRPACWRCWASRCC